LQLADFLLRIFSLSVGRFLHFKGAPQIAFNAQRLFLLFLLFLIDAELHVVYTVIVLDKA
jgi:hypothetical protein